MKFLTVLAMAGLITAQPIVLKTSTLLDGKGKTLQNTIVVIEGSKITRVGGAIPAGAVVYDLSPFTTSPGWIDTHSHIVYHFDNNNRSSGRDEPASQASWHIVENAVKTLNA